MGKVTRKGLKVLGVGLSRTGTTSLTKALEILGYKSEHSASKEIMPVLTGGVTKFDYRCYDHIDALTDSPTAVFYNEILAAYPKCKAILTVRDPDSWFKSMVRHDAVMRQTGWFSDKSMVLAALGWLEETLATIHRVTYGTYRMKELLLKKKFTEHNRHVIQDIPSNRLLIMDILGGDGWEPLCEFLGKPIPSIPFPFLHSAEEVAAKGLPSPMLGKLM